MGKLKDKLTGMKLNVKITVNVGGIILLSLLLFLNYIFYTMEKNATDDRKKALEYSLEQSYEQIRKNVESINMTTQFFLSDQKLQDFLVAEKSGQPYSTQELIQFSDTDILSLERMMNSNPYLYETRVYVDSTTMQEIMPILYRQDRMNKQAWASEEEKTGWKMDYTDRIFEDSALYQDEKILSLVTSMRDYIYGEIGILEVSMKMDVMFPKLYEQTEGEWIFFVDSTGHSYGRTGSEAQRTEYLPQVYGQVTGEGSPVISVELDGQKMVAGGLYIRELDGYLIGIYSMQEELASIILFRLRFLLLMVVAFIALVLSCNSIVKWQLKQFYEIIQSIRKVQKGNLDVVIEHCGNDEMGELGTQINKMLGRIKQLMNDNLQRELLVKNSEIKALQNQINAHFIYNVLESVKMMAEIDEEYEISDAITALGKLLRYSMKWTSGNVTVEQEIEYIRNYLKLINLRFDYEIYLSLNIPEEIMLQEIPKMSLQPIVENSIYHGIEQMAEDTNIYIKGFREGKDCIIEITDAGRGMSEEEVANLYRKIAGEIDSGGGSGNGIGLKNVQDRIRMCFGEAYGLEINSRLGCYTKVRVRVPMTKEYHGLGNTKGQDR